MVGTSPPPGLCSFSTQRRCSVDVKTITELRISAIKQDQRGWMSENYLSFQRREKCFLLTSPFIEPGQLPVRISSLVIICRNFCLSAWLPSNCTLLSVVVLGRHKYAEYLMSIRHRSAHLLAFALFAAFWSSTYLAAQTDLGAVQGHVQDQQSKAMAGASVTLRNPSTAFDRTVQTDASGNYSFLGV